MHIGHRVNCVAPKLNPELFHSIFASCVGRNSTPWSLVDLHHRALPNPSTTWAQGLATPCGRPAGGSNIGHRGRLCDEFPNPLLQVCALKQLLKKRTCLKSWAGFQKSFVESAVTDNCVSYFLAFQASCSGSGIAGLVTLWLDICLNKIQLSAACVWSLSPVLCKTCFFPAMQHHSSHSI